MLSRRGDVSRHPQICYFHFVGAIDPLNNQLEFQRLDRLLGTSIEPKSQIRETTISLIWLDLSAHGGLGFWRGCLGGLRDGQG